MATRALFLLPLLLLATPGLGQVPHPYAYGGLSLESGGYSPAAGTVGAGLNIDATRAIAIAELWADNAHKQDSGTGHDVGIRARAFYPIKHGWYGGAGVQWNKLVTSIYSKQAWRPTFGGGKDVIRESFSGRAQLMYVLPGTDRINAVQGPEISLWVPSPATRAHILYRQTLGLYEFHQSAVPGDSGIQDRSIAAFSEFTVMYRF